MLSYQGRVLGSRRRGPNNNPTSAVWSDINEIRNNSKPLPNTNVGNSGFTRMTPDRRTIHTTNQDALDMDYFKLSTDEFRRSAQYRDMPFGKAGALNNCQSNHVSIFRALTAKFSRR